MVYRKPGYQKLKRQIEKIVEERESGGTLYIVDARHTLRHAMKLDT